MTLLYNLLLKLGLIIQVLTAFFAFLNFYKYKHTSLKILLPFFVYLCINEFIGNLYCIYIQDNNSVIFNIYNIVEVVVFLYLYKQNLKSIKSIQRINVLIFLYLFITIINCFFDNFIEVVFSNTYLIGTIFVIYALTLYLMEVLNSEKLIYLNKSLLFWISFGLLVSYVPNIPFQIIIKYYLNSPTIPYIYNLMFIINIISNVLFIIGFICSNKQMRH